MKNVRWGIIGCGKVVRSKSGPCFNRIPNSSIQAVAQRNLAAAQDCAEHFGAKKFYNNYKELVDDPMVDAVYIASPPGLHLEQALYCAKKRKPVYIEKPFARNYAECKEIVNEFKKTNTVVYVAQYRRALPKFIKIKNLIKNNAIGDIYTFECNLNRIFEHNKDHGWMFNPKLSGGGKFFDISPHMIDILIFIFGDVKKTKTYTRNINQTHSLEEIVVAIIEMSSGLLGTINFNLSTDTKEDRVLLRGSKGQMEFSIHGEGPISIKRNGKIVDEVFIDNPKYIQESMVASVVQDLIENNENVCYGDEALETYRVIDEILDEHYGGRNRKFWTDFHD